MYFCAFPQFTYSISKYLENCWNFYFQHVHMCFISWKASFFLYIYIYIHLDINVFNFSMTNIPLHEPLNRLSEEINSFFFLNSYFWETIFFFHYFHVYSHLSFRRYNINRKWSGEIIFSNTKNSSIALSINPLELTILISILPMKFYHKIENLHIISSK